MRELITTHKNSAGEEFQADRRELLPTEGIQGDIDLTALMKPRFVMKFNINGTVVPFYYNLLDPGTMLITHGTPTAASAAISFREKIEKLGIDPDSPITEDNVESIRELLQDSNVHDIIEQAEDLKVNVLIKAVISPKLTREIIESLDPEYTDVLYDSITGGITTDNDSVNNFPETTGTSES